LWAKQFGFGDDFVSLLGAMSSNAISAGIGAAPSVGNTSDRANYASAGARC
jgi:hypothetical protein